MLLTKMLLQRHTSVRLYLRPSLQRTTRLDQAKTWSQSAALLENKAGRKSLLVPNICPCISGNRLCFSMAFPAWSVSLDLTQQSLGESWRQCWLAGWGRLFVQMIPPRASSLCLTLLKSSNGTLRPELWDNSLLSKKKNQSQDPNIVRTWCNLKRLADKNARYT